MHVILSPVGRTECTRPSSHEALAERRNRWLILGHQEWLPMTISGKNMLDRLAYRILREVSWPTTAVTVNTGGAIDVDYSTHVVVIPFSPFSKG